jgi:hypothetical protein
MTYGNMPPDTVLNAVSGFIRKLFWGPEEYNHAVTLLLAAGHVKNAFPAIPYVLATSKDPGVGKSTLTKDIPMLLGSRPWRVSRNTTTDALRNRFLDQQPPDLMLLDDAGKIFGADGMRAGTTPLYQLAIDGYVRNATVSVSRGGVTQDLPAYAQWWMNGLGPNVVPKDLRSRAVHFALTPKPGMIKLRDALSPEVAAEAAPLKKNLQQWAAYEKARMQEFTRDVAPGLHPRLADRLLQLWAPLFAVAHAAQGAWPQRCMSAFRLMALDASERPEPTLQQQVLLDTAKVLMMIEFPDGTFPDRVFTADLVPALRDLPAGQVYRDLPTRHLVEVLLPEVLGPAERMTGRALDGEEMTGWGRMAIPVLNAAASLRELLDPPPAPSEPAQWQDEMQLAKARRR